MIRRYTIDEFVKSLNVNIPDDAKFLKLKKEVSPYQSHIPIRYAYERGILLYSLIAKFKPKKILEIGTLHGFSALCMAWAATDYNIDATIYTIEPDSLDKKIKFTDENGYSTLLSTRDNWKRIAPSGWISKIKPIQGFSTEVLRTYQFPKIEFVLMEGSQHYIAAKSDFYSLLKWLDDDFRILIASYTPQEKEHVTQFIDEEIVPNFDVNLIETNFREYQNLFHNSNPTNNYQALCFIENSKCKNPISKAFPHKTVSELLAQDKKLLKRWKLRRKLNQKIPLFNKIKFSKFKF